MPLIVPTNDKLDGLENTSGVDCVFNAEFDKKGSLCLLGVLLLTCCWFVVVVGEEAFGVALVCSA